MKKVIVFLIMMLVFTGFVSGKELQKIDKYNKKDLIDLFKKAKLKSKLDLVIVGQGTSILKWTKHGTGSDYLLISGNKILAQYHDTAVIKSNKTFQHIINLKGMHDLVVFAIKRNGKVYKSNTVYYNAYGNNKIMLIYPKNNAKMNRCNYLRWKSIKSADLYKVYVNEKLYRNTYKTQIPFNVTKKGDFSWYVVAKVGNLEVRSNVNKFNLTLEGVPKEEIKANIEKEKKGYEIDILKHLKIGISTGPSVAYSSDGNTGSKLSFVSHVGFEYVFDKYFSGIINLGYVQKGFENQFGKALADYFRASLLGAITINNYFPADGRFTINPRIVGGFAFDYQLSNKFEANASGEEYDISESVKDTSISGLAGVGISSPLSFGEIGLMLMIDISLTKNVDETLKRDYLLSEARMGNFSILLEYRFMLD